MNGLRAKLTRASVLTYNATSLCKPRHQQEPSCTALAVDCGVRLRSYAVLPGTNVFDRKAKRGQRDRAAARSGGRDCDYLVGVVD